jgi:hypothetical protein
METFPFQTKTAEPVIKFLHMELKKGPKKSTDIIA